jgi:hypothetical protein
MLRRDRKLHKDHKHLLHKLPKVRVVQMPHQTFSIPLAPRDLKVLSDHPIQLLRPGLLVLPLLSRELRVPKVPKDPRDLRVSRVFQELV